MPSNKNADDHQEHEEGLIHFELAGESEREESEREDTRWLVQHYAELVEQYPFSWVAIQDRRVVGHGATPNQAMEHAMMMLDGKDSGPAAQNEKNAAQNENAQKDPRNDKNAKNAPHLYFLERSADWFLEH